MYSRAASMLPAKCTDAPLSFDKGVENAQPATESAIQSKYSALPSSTAIAMHSGRS